MPWQISISIYIIVSSYKSIQTRKLGLYKNDLTIYALVASFVCVSIIGLTYGLLSRDAVNHSIVLNHWKNLLAGGLLFSIINLFAIRLFRYVPASVAEFMLLLNTLSVLYIARIFLNESLTTKQIIGAGILLFVIILIGYTASKKKKKSSNRQIVLGVLLALATAILIGPAITNEKYLIDNIGMETYVIYGWGLQAFFSFILALMLKEKYSAKHKLSVNEHINVWVYSLLLAFSGIMFVLSLRNSNSASLPALTSTAKVAGTVLMAYVLLKERDNLPIKIFGIILTFVGLFLLFN